MSSRSTVPIARACGFSSQTKKDSSRSNPDKFGNFRGHPRRMCESVAPSQSASLRAVFTRGTLVSSRGLTVGGRSRLACQAGPLPSSWSNPRGEVLTEVVPGKLWVAQRPFVWLNIDVGGKMAVVRLEDGSLWVHSPVNLDPLLKQELAALGEVRHIVSPNYEHLKYASQWIQAYPQATSYGCPGLQELKPELKVAETIGDPSTPTPAQWPSEIEMCWMDCEVNPFNQKPFFNEVVFFHKTTASFIVTDLFWDWPDEQIPFQTGLFKWGMDRVFLPFYLNFMVAKKQEAFKRASSKVLAWPIERIIPCHGTVIESNAKSILKAHLLEGTPFSGKLES